MSNSEDSDNVELDGDIESDGDIDSDDIESSDSKVPKEDTVQIEAQAEVPKDIDTKEIVADISCHPKRNVVAVGCLDGSVTLYSYSIEASGNKEVITFEHHKMPVRAVKYSDSGDHLFTASQDASIYVVDLESSSVFRNFSRTDSSPIYSLLPIDNYLLASGEEDGKVVLWDYRMQTPVEVFQDCEDIISSLTVDKNKRTLLATSGDGYLTAYSIKGKKLKTQSEEFEHEFHCAGIFKENTKVVVGAGDGSLNIFNWDEFGNISDRFPGHPEGVDSMVVCDDDVVVTGCEDGNVRLVQLYPTRFLGILGDHSGFPVEKLSLSHDSLFVASSSHDQKVKFWDLSTLEDLKQEAVVKNKSRKNLQLKKQGDNFFGDLE